MESSVLNSAFAVGSVMFVLVFGAGVLAMALRAALPNAHLLGRAEDAIRQALGLVSTMAALVLGLLLASAQTQFSTDDGEMTELAARIIYIDRVLENYGPDAAPARSGLRGYVENMRREIWPESGARVVELDPSLSRGKELYATVEALSPQTDVQRALKSEVDHKAEEFSQMRWLLFERHNNSIAKPFVVVVICWLALIFFGYGLFAPANATVLVVFMGAALSVSSAMFLIVDLSTPFEGVIQISSKTMDVALSHLAR